MLTFLFFCVITLQHLLNAFRLFLIFETVNVSVSSRQGHITLASFTGLTMLGGTSGAYTRFISMRGTVSNINLALSALEYVRSPAFDGGDTIAVSLLSCNAWNEVQI